MNMKTHASKTPDSLPARSTLNGRIIHDSNAAIKKARRLFAMTWAAATSFMISLAVLLPVATQAATSDFPDGNVAALNDGVPATTLVDISGTITYCSNSNLPPVPLVTVNLTPGTPMTTNGTGFYAFLSLPSGSYDVTPTMAALAPGSFGINTVDVVAVQRHFLTIQFLSGCRLMAADVNGDSLINTVDVLAIRAFFLGLPTGFANVGKYQFNPPSYLGITSSQTAAFDALVLGDVAAVFVYP